MAVAYDASSESHTGITGSTSEASFSWTHTPSGTPRGVLVFVMQDNDSTDKVTSVTYGGTAVPAVSGGVAVDAVGEPRSCKAFFLGSSIPAGAQTVQVNRTNDATLMYAVAVTVTAGIPGTEVYTPGIVLQQGDLHTSEQSPDDGTPGTDSLRFAGGSFAVDSTPNKGPNSTGLQGIDFGSSVAQAVRETTAGQGARPVGFAQNAGGADDVAAVYLAVREVTNVTQIVVTPGTLTLTGQGITKSRVTAPVAGALTLTGASITVVGRFLVTPGAISFAGRSPIISGGTTFLVDPVGFALWSDPVAKWSGNAAWAGSAMASVVLSGQLVSTPVPSVVVAPGAITYAGAIAIAISTEVVVMPGAVTLMGAEVSFTERILVDPGAAVLRGSLISVSLTLTGPGIENQWGLGEWSDMLWDGGAYAYDPVLIITVVGRAASLTFTGKEVAPGGTGHEVMVPFLGRESSGGALTGTDNARTFRGAAVPYSYAGHV